MIGRITGISRGNGKFHLEVVLDAPATRVVDGKEYDLDYGELHEKLNKPFEFGIDGRVKKAPGVSEAQPPASSSEPIQAVQAADASTASQESASSPDDKQPASPASQESK